MTLLSELEASVEKIKREKGMADKTLETISGKVSEIGLFDGRPIKAKLEGRDGEWIQFSKPEYRKFWEDPQRGDTVKFGVSRYKDAWWAETCEIQHKGNSAQTTYEAGQVPTGGRELGIMREVCIKSAATIVTAWVSRLSAEVVFDRRTVSGNVLALAEDFERWLVREDVQFE